jgi:DNA-binding NarL/FixJ family response regulator
MSDVTDTDPATIRVLVVDDHQAFAELLAFALSAQPDITCVGVATSVDHGLAMATATLPDAVLLDIAINDEDGLAAIPRFHTAAPGVGIAVLTAHRGGSWAARAARAGARAFRRPARRARPRCSRSARTSPRAPRRRA